MKQTCTLKPTKLLVKQDIRGCYAAAAEEEQVVFFFLRLSGADASYRAVD